MRPADGHRRRRKRPRLDAGERLGREEVVLEVGGLDGSRRPVDDLHDALRAVRGQRHEKVGGDRDRVPRRRAADRRLPRRAALDGALQFTAAPRCVTHGSNDLPPQDLVRIEAVRLRIQEQVGAGGHRLRGRALVELQVALPHVGAGARGVPGGRRAVVVGERGDAERRQRGGGDGERKHAALACSSSQLALTSKKRPRAPARCSAVRRARCTAVRDASPPRPTSGPRSRPRHPTRSSASSPRSRRRTRRAR